LKSKRPENFQAFVDEWYAQTHEGRVALCARCGISIGTGRHWVSDSGQTQARVKLFPPAPMEIRPNEPTCLTTKKGLSKAIILGDTHCPYQDSEVVMAVEKFMAATQPDYIIYNGDLTDFYQVSSFAKDPSRLGQMQDDIDVTTTMFQRHKTIVPGAEQIMIEGTHENRWFKYLQEKAPAASKLRGMSISSLYTLPTLGITYVPFERGLLVNNSFLILHGDIANKHSSATAKAHFEKNGGSGLCNHTHRLGSYFKRDRYKTHGWWENGCLCVLNPDWLQNPDWQQGFSMITFEDTGRYFVEQIPIISNRFIYGGLTYSAET